MINATRSWKRVGVLILGLVSDALCTHHSASSIVTMIAGEDSGQNQKVNEEALYLALVGYCLEDSRIKEIMGKWFPNVKEVDIHEAPSCGNIVGGGNASEVAACTKVTKVMVHGSCSGSPTMLEHIKILFPEATDLKFRSDGAMPIHGLKDAEACEEKKLVVGEVTRLELISSNTAKPGLLFENLRLFPEVGELFPSGNIPGSLIGDNRKADPVLSHVKRLRGCNFPASKDFLSRLPTVFPSVEKLWIDGRTLESMTAGERGSIDSPCSFVKLTKLEVYFDKIRPGTLVSFGKRTREIFPLLSRIKFSFFSMDRTLLRPKDIFPVGTVTNIEVRGLLRCLPDFFDEMFPKLDSLVVAAHSDLKQLSSGKSFFHPQLRDLEISDSKDLEKILERMEEAQSGSDGVPVGGLDLPCLERLNIRGSFECKLPECFLQGCLGIKTLEMSVDPHRYKCSKNSWWKFLQPLSKLEDLHVQISRYKVTFEWDGRELQDKSEFSGNRLKHLVKRLSRDLRKARSSFKLHASIHFYTYDKSGREHITSIGLPEGVPG